MAKTKHRVSARKQAERMKQAMRQARLLEKLAALNLPPILGFMKPV